MQDFSARQSDAVLKFTDAAGNPLAGKKINITQTNHEFLFGCGAFDAIPAADPDNSDPFFKDRMDKWTRLYNYGTMSFYRGAYEKEEALLSPGSFGGILLFS